LSWERRDEEEEIARIEDAGGEISAFKGRARPGELINIYCTLNISLKLLKKWKVLAHKSVQLVLARDLIMIDGAVLFVFRCCRRQS
jgi:hypothetical protein